MVEGDLASMMEWPPGGEERLWKRYQGMERDSIAQVSIHGFYLIISLFLHEDRMKTRR